MKETGKKAGERETWHSQPEVTAQFRWQLAWKLDEWKDKCQVCEQVLSVTINCAMMTWWHFQLVTDDIKGWDGCGMAKKMLGVWNGHLLIHNICFMNYRVIQCPLHLNPLGLAITLAWSARFFFLSLQNKLKILLFFYLTYKCYTSFTLHEKWDFRQ